MFFCFVLFFIKCFVLVSEQQVNELNSKRRIAGLSEMKMLPHKGWKNVPEGNDIMREPVRVCGVLVCVCMCVFIHSCE